MRVDPIPNELLGSRITLEIPSGSGFYDRNVYNVRVERVEEIDDYTSQKSRDNTRIFVWFDYVNSYPDTEFSVGMRIRYDGEVFEIIKQKVYSADSPHHCKIEARKISDCGV